MGMRRNLDTYFAQGLLNSRSTFHLTVRLAARANQFLLASGAAGEGTGMWRAVLPLFVILDVAVWVALRRSDRFGVRWRLPLDCLDTAFWSLSPQPASGYLGFATLVLMPLAVEAGFRWGVAGFAVAGVHTATVLASRAFSERGFFAADGLWGLLSVAMGMLLWAYCDRLHRQAEADHAREVEAGRRQAHLAGQNSVAMGASSVVDAIEGLLPVLGRPPEGSAMRRLAEGWKADLARATAASASYLQTALMEWQRNHNRHPDLRSLAELHVGEGEGTTLLTGRQAAWLWTRLSHIAPGRGTEVRLAEPGVSRVPGSELLLLVGAREIRVPPDPVTRTRVVDPGPTTYVFMAVLAIAGVTPALGALRPAAAAVLAAAALAAGWWSHVRLVRLGRRSIPQVFAVAAVVGAFLVVFSGLFLSRPTGPDGDPFYSNAGLMLVAMLGGFYARELRPGAVGGALVTTAALMAAAAPGPGVPAAFAGAVLWGSMPYPICRRVAKNVDLAARRYLEDTTESDRANIRNAFAEGQVSVVSLVLEARDDALRQLDHLRATLHPDLAHVVGRRLEEVDQRLLSMPSPGPASGPASGSSS